MTYITFALHRSTAALHVCLCINSGVNDSNKRGAAGIQGLNESVHHSRGKQWIKRAPCCLKHHDWGLVSLMMACIWYSVFYVCELTKLDMCIQRCLWNCNLYMILSGCSSETKWQPLPSLSFGKFSVRTVYSSAEHLLFASEVTHWKLDMYTGIFPYTGNLQPVHICESQKTSPNEFHVAGQRAH